MARIRIRDKNRIPQVLKTIDQATKKKARVGYFGEGEIQMIAAVHEFGITIKPKKAKYLAIPIAKESIGKSPKDFGDLITIPTKTGKKMMGRKSKNSFEPLFLLANEVIIPERSFIRTGTDKHESDVRQKAKDMIDDVLLNNISVDLFYKALGLELKGKIQEFARNLDSPANSGLTSTLKGSSNPLVDTGNMIGSMEVEVE